MLKHRIQPKVDQKQRSLWKWERKTLCSTNIHTFDPLPKFFTPKRHDEFHSPSPFTPHPLPSWAGSRDQIIHQGQNIVLIDLEILRTNIKWNVWDSVMRTETYWYLRMLSSVFYFIHRKMSPAACQHKAWFQGVSRYVLRAQSLWLS